MDNLSGQTIRGYQLQDLIGAGGFGAVYQAYQPLVKREVAIKIILPEYANHPDFIRRFEAEAQLVARLEHLNIVPLYDYWREPGGAYLVMRLLKGGSLRGLIKHGPIDLKTTSRMLDQITAALTTAHRNGVVHRDLKPDNLLLDEDQNVYLADFGIAKDLEDKEANKVAEEYIVGSPSYLSPEQVREETVSPQTDIYSLGIVLYEMLTGSIPFPGLPASTLLFKHLHDPLPSVHEVRPDLPYDLNEVIQKATAKTPADRYPSAIALATAFHQALAEWQKDTEFATRMPLLDGIPDTLTEEATLVGLFEPENPYKGLRSFQEADAADFFGRESLVDRLLARLKEDTANTRFLAVVGPSGSGKSSVVKAGLIPALRQGALAGSNRWFMVEITPGTHPLEELEAGLLRVAINPPPSLIDQLREDSRGLARAVKRILPPDDSELLLVIDQFEEVFTMVADEAARDHFLDCLLAAASDPRSRLRIIATLRADFYDRPLLYPAFGDLMRQRTEVVLPLSKEELERAITMPAQRVGLRFEPGLAASIMAEIGEQPGTLPLLQYALSELYERREGRSLTLKAYQDSGKVLGALARRADELYSALNTRGQQLARQLFLRLVTLGEGTEDTRRRVRQTELATSDDADMQKVIEQFGKYRLLTFDRDPVTRGPTLEVAHEALIRQWGQLRQWLDDSREDLRSQRRLTAATEEWANAGKEPSFLLTGTRLEQLESWSKETDLALNPQEQAFLKASITEREKRQAEEAARQAHEALLEKRSRQRLRALVVVMLLATVGALILTGFAFNQSQIAQQNAATATIAQGAARDEANNAATAAAIAEQNANDARSLAFASSSQLALSRDNTDLAIVLALAANQIGQPSIPGQRTLANAAYAPGTRRIFAGHQGRVLGIAYSPDGKTALSASTDFSLILWNIETGAQIRQFKGHKDWVRAVAFSPDGKRAASGSSDQTAILWDVETGSALRTLEGHKGVVYSVSFSPDNTQLLSAAGDKTVILWDVTSGQQIRKLEGHTDEVLSVAFSSNGFTALSGSRDKSLILWNVQSGEAITRLEGHTGKVNSVAFSPDETAALSGSEDGNVILWDFETGQPRRRFTGHTAQVHSVTFSPDGLTAASAAEDNAVILWDVVTGAERHRFLGHTQLVDAVRFSPNGRQLLSGSWDGEMRLWDINSGAELNRFDGHTDMVNSVAYSPDGKTALSVSTDTSIVQWDVTTGQQMRKLEGHTGPVNIVVYSPDGQTALSGSDDTLMLLWDVKDSQIVRKFEGHSDAVLALAFSPDSKTAVSGSKDNTLILWDVASGQQLRRFIGHVNRVTGVAFSPDGKSVLSSSFDNHLILWDIASGNSLRTFEGHTDWVRSVVFSPDGKTALSAASDNTLILWDVGSGERLRRFEGHTAQIYSAVFSPDGKLALSGSSDTTAIVWDVNSGAELFRLTGHNDAVLGVGFSPDGKTALTASGDKSMRLWQVSATLQDLMSWTKANRYIRDLTCPERELYRVEPLCPPPTPGGSPI